MPFENLGHAFQKELSRREPRRKAWSRYYGEKIADSQGQASAKIQGKTVQPVQYLRTAAGLPAQVRHVPDLFPAAGFAGRSSRRYEVKLVEARLRACGNVRRAPVDLLDR